MVNTPVWAMIGATAVLSDEEDRQRTTTIGKTIITSTPWMAVITWIITFIQRMWYLFLVTASNALSIRSNAWIFEDCNIDNSLHIRITKVRHIS